MSRNLAGFDEGAEEEHAPLSGIEKKLLDGGFPAYLEAVSEFHGVLDHMGKELRDTKASLALAETRVDTKQLKIYELYDELAQMDDELSDAQRTLDNNFVRHLHVGMLIEQFVRQVSTCRKVSSAGALQLASAFVKTLDQTGAICDALHRFSGALEFDNMMGTGAPYSVGFYYLCRLSCTLPKPYSSMDDVYQSGEGWLIREHYNLDHDGVAPLQLVANEDLFDLLEKVMGVS